MKKIVQFTTIIFLFFIIASGIVYSSNINNLFVNQIKDVWTSSNDLEENIKEYALEHNSLPIEPRIDKVWKLIPGYNGLVIDQQATLKLHKSYKNLAKDDIMPFVWKEIEPKTSINDLGPYPIYRGNPNKPQVSFMINVAWGTEYLEPILDILDKENIKATFFLDGTWTKNNPEMARKLVESGHEVGNHAYTHPQMSKLSVERIRQEIIKTEEIIYQTTNTKSIYFAPPSGDFDQRVVKEAYNLNLKTVLWTLDTVDWQKPTPSTIVKRIVPKIDNGNLILMHPTKSTLEALPQLIKDIKEKGLNISSVSETFSTKRIQQVEAPYKF